MALTAGIAHMPEGIAKRTGTSHPGRGLSTSGLSFSSELLSLLVSGRLCSTHKSFSNHGEDACWLPQSPSFWI